MATDRFIIDKKIRTILDNAVMIANQLEDLKDTDSPACAATYLQVIEYLKEKNELLKLTKPLSKGIK